MPGFAFAFEFAAVVSRPVRASNMIECRRLASTWVSCTARQVGLGTARWSPVSSSAVTSSKIRSAYPALFVLARLVLAAERLNHYPSSRPED